jgi:hypothetical protein
VVTSWSHQGEKGACKEQAPRRQSEGDFLAVLTGGPQTEGRELLGGYQRSVTGVKGVTPAVHVFTGVGVLCSDDLDSNSTKEERTGTEFFNQQASVVKGVGGCGVLTVNGVTTVYGLLQNHIVEWALDFVFFDPLKGPVFGVLEGRNERGGVKAGHQGASDK